MQADLMLTTAQIGMALAGFAGFVTLLRRPGAIVLFGACVLTTVTVRASTGDDAALQYQQAFYANAIATLERMKASNPETARVEKKTAQVLTDCHMRVMAVYSPELREAAFAVIRKGRSYLQAKDAFNGAVATEAAAGGAREAAVRQMFEKALVVGQECLKQLQQENPQ
jgi:hypothetical protein